MRSRLPSPATVIASVALFVSLGGTTYAVTVLPRDSVGSTQLRRGAVKEADLGTRSVVTAKLAERAVTARKLAPRAVTADKVAPDALTGAQIAEGTLAAVPLAADAERARVAERAASAERADSAGRAASAAQADLANRAGVADALAGIDTNQQTFAIPDGGFDIVTVACDANFVPLSGGYLLTAASDVGVNFGSGPAGAGWRVEVADVGSGNGRTVEGTAYAVCVRAAA